MSLTLKIYLNTLLNIFTINLRTEKHKISLTKHIALGIVIGIMLGIVLTVLYPDYSLSIWGNKIACPLVGGSTNVVGCNAAFIYVPTFFGAMFGGIIGFFIGVLRRFIEMHKKKPAPSKKKDEKKN